MHNETNNTSAERVILEAIARHRLVSATYNGAELTLAPHQLFRRHGALFISAINTGRNWREDEELRLGQFKLDGLSSVTITEAEFEPLAAFANEPARDGDEPVFAVAFQ